MMRRKIRIRRFYLLGRGPSVMEPSVDGVVIRPTPDEYEDGEEAV